MRDVIGENILLCLQITKTDNIGMQGVLELFLVSDRKKKWLRCKLGTGFPA